MKRANKVSDNKKCFYCNGKYAFHCFYSKLKQISLTHPNFLVFSNGPLACYMCYHKNFTYKNIDLSVSETTIILCEFLIKEYKK